MNGRPGLHAALARGALAAAAVLGAPASAPGQPYPARPVRIIVAFAPGGGNDLIARFIAQRLTAALGQQFLVENRPGAAGTIGFQAGIRSPADGYTLTLVANTYAVNPSFYRLGYDPLADMTPVVQLTRGPLVVVVNPSLPVTNIRELIALAKSKPGEIDFASTGSGGHPHLAAELFAAMAGIRLNHVPYKGTGPALADTIAGQTKLLFSTTEAALPHVKSGRLRALAVTTLQRIPAAPDIPTVDGSGLPGYEVVVWHGLIGPKGLPRPIVDRINSAVNLTLQAADAAETLESYGVSPAGGTPKQFLEAIGRDLRVWRRVVQAAGLKAE